MLSKFKKNRFYQSLLQRRERTIEYKNYQERFAVPLKKIKNIHKGERCFVIGNGPSLTADDLTCLKNEYTFASNMIYRLFDKTEWRPTYYCISDQGVLAKVLDEGAFLYLNPEYFFFQYYSKFVFNNRPYPDNSLLYYLEDAKDYNKSPRFACDLSKEAYDAQTVTYIMLQIAAYMGFHEIYLIGVDHSFAKTVSNSGKIEHHDVKWHFYDDKKAEKDVSLTYAERMTMGYESAERYSKKHGFRIYNATRGGKLEAFERVDFDTLVFED